MVEFGMNSLKLVLVLLIKFGKMMLVCLLKYHAVMADNGTMALILVNAH